MGAILSLIMASEYEFNGVFTIGAPIGINNPFLKILPIINLFKKYYKTEAKQLKKDTNGKWVGYEKIPINVGIKIKTLLKEMEKSLSKISCPIILFQGKNDSVIKKTSMNEIFEKISSKEKYKIWLENSDHPILCISDHEKIVSELIAFIEGL
ncbi:MAG: alpha/beta hydrolase [Candidatus Lokiarchaeota archaeon]